MWSTMSSFVRESEAHQFLLFNITSKYSEVLEEVPKDKLQPGDILLFPMDVKYCIFSSIFKHVVIYCGDGEVIHFLSRVGKPAWIIKEGFRVIKMERKEYQVYRKKGGINLNDFRVKVRKAMNSQATYHLLTNNSIHFALFLVGLADFYMEEVEIHNEAGSCSDGAMLSFVRESETHQFLLFDITSKYSEVLEEVPKDNLQPGDILLFPLDNQYGRASGIFKRAAVYCGDGEVIHFLSTVGKPAWIIKEGFRVMKMERKEYWVYRKKGGIDLNDFRVKVRKAMNSEATYHLWKNNSIHFALFLVGLVEFYMKEVETPDEDYSYSNGASLNIAV